VARQKTMSAATYFIAGTDTEVGKTRVTAALLTAAREQGIAAAGMKPVAAGAERIDGRLASPDALQIAAASGQTIPYEDLNPYCLIESISPHIAADKATIMIDTARIATIALRLQQGRDLLLIEGAGGWYTPISPMESMADVARALASPVILVVGLRLGCLNHARLSLEAIHRCGCRLAGWVANQIDPAFAMPDENLATLEQLMGSAPLAVLPHARASTHDAAHVRGALAYLLESKNCARST
jgi:dethiobiotin synthetase